MSIPAGTDQVTACGAALIEHGSARYSWNERPEGAKTYADDAGYVCTSGKTGGTADKSLFVPGRFMDLPGTFCMMCPAYIGKPIRSAGEHTGQDEPADSRKVRLHGGR